MRLYLIAGEISGDAHGAAMMKALQRMNSEVEFSGAGGPQMMALSKGPFLEWTSHAVVGLLEVVKNFGYFRHQYYRMLAEIANLKPQAVILIDYPGFNLSMAKALRKSFPNIKLIYYISPQVWAWNRGRIPKMAKWLDLMICLFPFEKELYEKSGLHTVFSGHPMLDELETKRIPNVIRDAATVGLFPGSREREVRKILPLMLDSAKLMLEKRPELKFVIPAATEDLHGLITKMIADLPHCKVELKNAYALMQTCSAAMIASGTATLEAAFFELPYVLLYKIAPFSYALSRLLIRIPFIGIANILAGREVVPEFLQKGAVPEIIAHTVQELIYNPMQREKMLKDLREVIALLGDRGASEKAAQAVFDELQLRPS